MVKHVDEELVASISTPLNMAENVSNGQKMVNDCAAAKQLSLKTKNVNKCTASPVGKKTKASALSGVTGGGTKTLAEKVRDLQHKLDESQPATLEETEEIVEETTVIDVIMEEEEVPESQQEPPCDDHFDQRSPSLQEAGGIQVTEESSQTPLTAKEDVGMLVQSPAEITNPPTTKFNADMLLESLQGGIQVTNDDSQTSLTAKEDVGCKQPAPNSPQSITNDCDNEHEPATSNAVLVEVLEDLRRGQLEVQRILKRLQENNAILKKISA